jgi:hypothetical protein
MSADTLLPDEKIWIVTETDRSMAATPLPTNTGAVPARPERRGLSSANTALALHKPLKPL